MRHIISDLESLSFQSMNHQLIIVDHHWMIRSCNRAWQQGLHQLANSTNVAIDNLHYLHLMESWATNSQSTSTTEVIQYLRSNAIPFNRTHTYEICVTTDYNEEIWFRVELNPLNQDNSALDINLALIAHTDITEQKQLEHQWKSALSEVRTLRGLLPICAVCKHIKDEADEWSSVEHYLEKHTHAEFTHDICPDCIRQLYPKYSGILDKHP